MFQTMQNQVWISTIFRKIIVFLLLFFSTALLSADFKTITFPSSDGVIITADLYTPYEDLNTPFIVLFHQAGFSRGEYREIAPRLNKLGFNCMAIDQRSGDGVNGVENETLMDALEKDKEIEYIDAIVDIKSALLYARSHFAKGKLLGWGSSYSAGLILKVAGDQPLFMNGVLAFSPGEYFKPKELVIKSAKNIKIPTFITSAKKEEKAWSDIYKAISAKKASFIPKTAGLHGSKALWNKQIDSEAYWKAVEAFLKDFKR